MIDGHAVGVLEVFLHHGDVVCHGFLSVLAANELRHVVHRSRTIQRVHRDEVVNHGRLQFTQVFPHTGRLELEYGYRATLLEQLIGQLVVDRYMVDIDVDTACFLHVPQTFLDDGQRDEAKEVHLNQTHMLHHMPVVFGHQHTFLAVLVLHGTQRRKVRQVVRSDDHATGVYTYLANRAFQPRCIFQHRARVRIAVLVFLLQLVDIFVAIAQVHFRLLRPCRQTFEHVVRELAVGNQALQFVHARQWYLLHTAYIGERRFGRHLAVCNDMRHVRLAVFATHVVQHFAASAIFEVGIDIRQRDTVGVQESLEQQVVFERVEVGNLQAIRHHRTCRRATARTNRDAKLFARRTDIVAHDEEVTRETHGLHHMQLELDAFDLFLGEVLAITFMRTIPSQFRQIVGFEFDTIESIVASHLLHLLLPFLLAHDDIAMLVAGELIEEVFLGVLLAVFLFRAKILGDREFRHDRVGVDTIGLHLVDDLLRVLQSKRHIGEDASHFLWCLQPFLLGVVHS